MPSIEKIKSEAQEFHQATREQLMGYITAALSVVAGLAWNDAISSAIKEFFPAGASNVIAKFFYAFLMTLVIVLLTVAIRRVLGGEKK